MNVKATLTSGFAYSCLNDSTCCAVSSIFSCGAPAAFRSSTELHLAEVRADFAFETPLASRSFAPWLARLKRRG